jgi:peptidyl-prolyl cis-trans isomerase D
MDSTEEFKEEVGRKAYQYKQMLGGQFDEKMLAQFQVPQRTLQEMIQLKLVSQQAKAMGFTVSNAEFFDFIRSQPYFQKNGKFDPELYNNIPNRGMREQQQLERLQASKLQTYLNDRFHFTPTTLRNEYELKETKVDIEFAKIDFKALSNKYKPSTADVEAFAKSAPQAELETYYKAHEKDFKEPAETELRQIRVGIPFQAADAIKKTAKKKIDDAYAEVTKGKPFAEVAKSVSDDEYAKKGGLVGWVKKGTVDPTLDAAISTLEVGKVSSPVETPFGYYVLLADKKKPEVVKPLADVKKTIAEKLLIEKRGKEFADKKRMDFEKILAEGKSIEAELKKEGIEIKKTGVFALGQGSIPSIGQADNILDGVFQLTPEKPIGNKLYDYNEQSYFIKLKSYEKAKMAELSKPETQKSIEDSLSSNLSNELMQKWVTALEKSGKIKTQFNFAAAGLNEVEH